MVIFLCWGGFIYSLQFTNCLFKNKVFLLFCLDLPYSMLKIQFFKFYLKFWLLTIQLHTVANLHLLHFDKDPIRLVFNLALIAVSSFQSLHWHLWIALNVHVLMLDSNVSIVHPVLAQLKGSSEQKRLRNTALNAKSVFSCQIGPTSFQFKKFIYL